jgi:exoribonuclease-2
MNVFYEEDGQFKVGSIFADNNTSLQVEAPHGKRSEIKAQSVLLRFDSPLTVRPKPNRRRARSTSISCGRRADRTSSASRTWRANISAVPPHRTCHLLLRLHGAPMHFYKKGHGRYKPAPADAIRAALASVERKRLQAEMQTRYVAQLSRGELPAEFVPHLNALLY